MKLALLLAAIFPFQVQFAQEFVNLNGVFFEKPIDTDTSKYKYSKDNISYRPNMTFIYDYWYSRGDQKCFKFMMFDNSVRENPMDLSPNDALNDSVIHRIKLFISDSRKLGFNDHNYTQTICEYSFLNWKNKRKDTLCEFLKAKRPSVDFNCKDEATGIVDNKKNLWMHPPRTYSFKILQLNPYPFYVLDDNQKYWTWSLEAGGEWLDPRWFYCDSSITVESVYERKKDETIVTPFGKLKCKIVKAVGTFKCRNVQYNTFLKSYYHPNYGFVRLEYKNADGSKITICLVDVK